MASYGIEYPARHYQNEATLNHPCDRNNCRCQSSTESCMYYNNAQYTHRDWSEVQGLPIVPTDKAEKFSDKSEKFGFNEY